MYIANGFICMQAGHAILPTNMIALALKPLALQSAKDDIFVQPDPFITCISLTKPSVAP